MRAAQNKTYRQPNILETVLKQSPTTKQLDNFNRIEARYVGANMAKLKVRLERYKKASLSKTFDELSGERHYSYRLGLFLRASGFPKPGAGWEAHHLVSGIHAEAAAARFLLALDEIKIRIDDPDNGCWMPKSKKYAWPSIHPNAIPHGNIHRQRYYDWVYRALSLAANQGQAKAILLRIRAQLLDGNIPPELLQEIDEARYNSWNK